MVQKKKIKPFSALIEALEKISRAIISELPLNDILKTVVNVSAEVLNLKICSLMLLDEEKKELVIRATQAVSEEYLKKPNLKLGQGVAGIVAQQGKPMVIKDVRKDPRYVNQEVAKKEKLCSLISLPLIVRGKTIGVLNVYTSRPHRFTKDEVNVLSVVASQAALAIENAQLQLKSKTAEEKLEERKIIERAKEILMEKGLSGEEAYQRMRKQSMDSRKPIKEIAEAILLTKDLNTKY